QTKRWRATS
ncbi:peptidase M66 family protein, partial [Vibrio parahaemolyticus EKP-021]